MGPPRTWAQVVGEYRWAEAIQSHGCVEAYVALETPSDGPRAAASGAASSGSSSHQFHGNGGSQRRSVARLPVPYGGPSWGLTNPGSEWAVPHIVGHLLASGVAPAIFWAEETPKEAPSLPWKIGVQCPHRGH